MLFLILLQTVIGALIVLDIPFLYYPVMILSTGGVLVILSMVYTLIWTISVKKENTLTTWKDGIPLFLAGIITAMIQIGLMDLIRFSLTGTWQGFQL